MLFKMVLRAAYNDEGGSTEMMTSMVLCLDRTAGFQDLDMRYL